MSSPVRVALVSDGRVPPRELLIETAEAAVRRTRDPRRLRCGRSAWRAGQRNNGVTQYHFGDKDRPRRRHLRASLGGGERPAARAAGRGAGRGTRRRDATWWRRTSSRSPSRSVRATRTSVSSAGCRPTVHRDVLLSARRRGIVGVRADRPLLRRRHLDTLSPRDLLWNRWTLTVNTAISALGHDQAGAAALPGGRRLPLEVFTSELVDALTGMLTPTGAVLAST